MQRDRTEKIENVTMNNNHDANVNPTKLTVRPATIQLHTNQVCDSENTLFLPVLMKIVKIKMTTIIISKTRKNILKYI